MNVIESKEIIPGRPKVSRVARRKNSSDSELINSGRLTAAEFAALQRSDVRSIGFIDGLMLLQRHKWLIGFTVAICTLLAVIVTHSLPRIYVASSTVVLERKDSRPFEIEAQLKSQDRDRSGTETEMDIMTSRLVAGHVVDALNLVEDPAFNKYFGTMKQSSGGVIANNDLQRDAAISTLISQLSVSRKGESLAISIRIANANPNMAAKIADSIADTYVEVSMEFKRQFASKALQFLKERGSNPLLAALRTEDAKLRQTRAELAAKLGENHPEIRAIEAKIDQVRVMISGEFTRMSEDLDNETERPSARVLSRAQIPTEPTYPKSNMIILGAFAGSALLSIIMALVSEGLGTAIRNGEQTMQLLQLPNLAYVPIVPKSWRGPQLDPVQEILKRPQSGFAVSTRSLYLACRLPNSDRPHQVIMLLSCLPGEGKTRLSIGLAAAAAADGRKTALVDLDRRNSKILKMLKLGAASQSLDSFLSGECRLSDVACQSPDIQGLSVIALAQRPLDPSVLLNSDRLRQLVEVLRTKFDFIVIDTPPVLSADDANWLAPLVDAAILVLTWGSTKEGEVWDAASSLRLHQAPLIGTVINEVDPRLQSRFGLGKVVR